MTPELQSYIERTHRERFPGGGKSIYHTPDGAIEATFDGAVMIFADAPIVVREPRPVMNGAAPMPWQFDRVEVINLAKRKDRKLQLLTHLREIGWPFREPDWHVATPGKALTPPAGWHSTRNVWANLQSHLAIIRRAYADGLENVLIMEDDCLYLPGFLPRVGEFLRTAPDDWGMLMLGGRFCVRNPRRERVIGGVWRVGDMHNLESYAVHRRFMPAAIAALESGMMHSDEILAGIQFDAPTYHMIPTIATQRAGWSDNFSVRKSDRESRMSASSQVGAVILSTGKKRHHMLANAAASFRRNNPALGLHLFTDSDWKGYDITAVESKTGLSSRHQKTRLLAETPFEKGILLDDDTITMKQLPSVDSVLGDCDIALAPGNYTTMGSILRSNAVAVSGWLSREEAAYTLEQYPGCDAFPHFNTGVIFYRKTPAIIDLSRVWHEEWKRFGKIDQMAFFRALQITGVKVKMLPRELHDIDGKTRKPSIVHLIHTKRENYDQWLRKNGLPVVPIPKVPCCQKKTALAPPVTATIGRVSAITDPRVWGPARWAALHGRALRGFDDNERWFNTWLKNIPCEECRAATREWMLTNAPDFGTGFFAWGVALHNHANERTGAAMLTESEARERWTPRG